MKRGKMEVVRGSGNVFRDLGHKNADVEQFKAILAAEINALDQERLTVRAALTAQELPRPTSRASKMLISCQLRLKIPHISGRKFPSPREVVVESSNQPVQDGHRLVKRRRAMQECTPPRNSWPQTHQTMSSGRSRKRSRPRSRKQYIG
jgi:hypothetical protein